MQHRRFTVPASFVPQDDTGHIYLTAEDVQGALDVADSYIGAVVSTSSTNASNIADLQTDVGTNASDITDLQAAVTAINAKYQVSVLSSSATFALTSTATKIPLTSATLTVHRGGGSDWILYDSGSGFHDAVQYVGSRAITMLVTAKILVGHIAADSAAAEVRALCYLNASTNQPHGTLQTNTLSINSSGGQTECTVPISFVQNDYLTYRAAELLTGTGGSANAQINAYGYSIIMQELG